MDRSIDEDRYLVKLLEEMGEVPGINLRGQVVEGVKRLVAERSIGRKVLEKMKEACIAAGRGRGHNHWDSTMRHGAGCQLCLEQIEGGVRRDELIKEAEELLR